MREFRRLTVVVRYPDVGHDRRYYEKGESSSEKLIGGYRGLRALKLLGYRGSTFPVGPYAAWGCSGPGGCRRWQRPPG